MSIKITIVEGDKKVEVESDNPIIMNDWRGPGNYQDGVRELAKAAVTAFLHEPSHPKEDSR